MSRPSPERPSFAAAQGAEPNSPGHLSTGVLAQLACALEVAAPKPGNVHPGASFGHLSWLDFLAASVVIGPVFERAESTRVGRTVLDAVDASLAVTASNANLGIVLLIAPLARVPRTELDVRRGVDKVLRELDDEDCRLVYEAIRRANPHGLGDAPKSDVRGDAPSDLIAAMRLSEDRDFIARQYANGFADVFDRCLPRFRELLAEGRPILATIVRFFLDQLAAEPDSHIARRCGENDAAEASRRAARAFAAEPDSPESHARITELDRWLREADHRRNPGTTADVTAATLFLSLRTGIIRFPFSG